MDRREFMTTAGAAAGLALATSASRVASAARHETHAPDEPDPALTAFVISALACTEAGNACVRHCIADIRAGGSDLVECLDSVLRTHAVVTAAAEVASLDTQIGQRTRELISVCAAYCKDCHGDCRKHAEHHEACRKCMEACDACIEACNAVLRA